MEEDNYKYVFLPLSILQRIYTHPDEIMEELICMGIFMYARQIRLSRRQVIGQLLKLYMRQYDEFTEKVDNFLERAENHVCFTDMYDEDDPDDTILEVEEYLVEYYPRIEEHLTEFCQLYQAKFKLDLSYDIPTQFNYLSYLRSYCVAGDPLVSVKVDMLFEYRDKPKKKYEMDMLVCYLAIRSIIGKKEFAYTTKRYIACRMIGVKSPEYLKEQLKRKELKAVYKTYSKRYQMDKILSILADKKFLVKMAVPQLRRIYVSTRLSLPELGEAVFKSLTEDKHVRSKERKGEERREAQKLMKRLWGENSES